MLQDPDLLALQEVRTKVEKAWAAWQKFRSFSQEQVDAIVEHMAAAARAQAVRLAELAVEETSYGNVKDKVAKNLLAADLLPRTMRGMRTVGVLREDAEKKTVEIAVPMGVVAAILPTTNPTSTAIYKTLISVKAGNAVVLSPHPRARRCTCETAAVLIQAAIEAGAPEDLVQCVLSPTLESTNALMRHRRTGVILSTGGTGIVRAAYSSGKPALGVGPGNVPVLVDQSADLADAVAKVVAGKSFDYGTVCSSEQAIVAERALRDRILAELKKHRAFLCDDRQKQALARILLLPPNWTVNPNCVGQSPRKIAQMAGFDVPEDTSVLAVEVEGVGKEHPLSAEKLSPVLSLFFVSDFGAALDTCESILRFGGLGHTCVIHARDDRRVREYALRMPAMRVLCNTPAPHGSTGITTNVFPAMTLGCGAVAGNITGDNIGPRHLMNIKRLAYETRRAEDAFEMPAVPARARAAAAVSSPAAPVTLSRGTIAAAVERYLASRGGAVAPPSAPAASGDAAGLVDRFLSTKKPREAVPPPPASCCAVPEPESRPEPAAGPPHSPELAIADFVCENDVRAAMQRAARIYIGPKTIVTPAARDLAAQHDILVVAKR